MLRVMEGGNLEVSVAEEFIVERLLLPGGNVTEIVVQDGIEHTRSDILRPTGSFGARLRVEEFFICLRPGNFVLSFKSGRPWESERTVVTTTVLCR